MSVFNFLIISGVLVMLTGLSFLGCGLYLFIVNARTGNWFDHPWIMLLLLLGGIVIVCWSGMAIYVAYNPP